MLLSFNPVIYSIPKFPSFSIFLPPLNKTINASASLLKVSENVLDPMAEVRCGSEVSLILFLSLLLIAKKSA